MQLDLVCPVIARDLGRFEILLESLRAFWKVPGRRIAAVPAKEMALFEQYQPEIELVAKEDVISTVPYDRAVPGWYRQQMVKLGIANHLGSGAYMAIDSDCFVAKPLHVRDLMPSGKLPYLIADDPGNKEEYYRGSGAALDLDFMPAEKMSWRPPFFFDVGVVQQALCRMEEKEMPWAEVLSRTPRWGEVFVYHLMAAHTGELDKMHYASPSLTHEPIRWPHVDVESDFAAWDLNETFSGKYAFGVIHSNTNIDPTRVAAKLKGKFV